MYGNWSALARKATYFYAKTPPTVGFGFDLMGNK